jgi:hypothetical protein
MWLKEIVDEHIVGTGRQPNIMPLQVLLRPKEKIIHQR